MANQEENSITLTKLLSDSIPEEDAFGGHEKVANAIYGIIKDEEEGGKAIALSGSFGSGKSTVVDFLKRKFNHEEKRSEKDTGIFIFDAWEHQGNPLRRAFIEEYIDFLRNDVGWANEKEYKEQLDLVSKNREEINTTTEPSLTTLGGWFALLLLLMPLGLGLFRAGMMDDAHWFLYWSGLGLLVLPFLYLIGVYVCWRPFTEEQKERLKHRLNLPKFGIKDFFSKNRTPFHRKSIFNFFSKKSREKIKSTSLKSPDPTTIEFQDVFNTITTEVLENKDRNLIIVIDNIDRLTTKSSIDAWTTLRTFFENENKDWEWKDQFWLIAPFDLAELKNLWSGLDHLNDSGKNGESEKTSEYVQAFVDKTFQVLFRVPQPVLSDWKVFFEKQLHKAFPNIGEEEKKTFKDISTLYQLKVIKKSGSPTPRDIKQFINRVGALYRIWHDKNIKLSTLAFYELVAPQENKQIIQQLKENKLVDSTSKVIINEKELNRKLAAIHFNCDLNKAYQILYGNQVAMALQNGQTKELLEYYETDGFRDVLRSEFATILGNRVPLSLSNCALCLKSIEGESSHNFDSNFYRLSNAYKEVSSIPPINQSIGEGIIAIWGKIGLPDDWIKLILDKITGVKVDEKELSIKSWYKVLNPILIKLDEKNKLHLLKDNLKIPGNASDYIIALNFISDLNKKTRDKVATYLKPNKDNEEVEVVQAFTSSLSSNEITNDLGIVLYLMFQSQEINIAKWDWQGVVNQIKQVITVGSNSNTRKIENAIELMLVLSIKLENKHALKLTRINNFKDGLYYLINNSSEYSYGLLYLAVILLNPDNNASNNNQDVRKGRNIFTKILQSPNENEDILNGLLSYIIRLEVLEDFLQIQSDRDHFSDLSRSIIQKVFQSKEALELVSLDLIFGHFNDFYQSIKLESLTEHINTLFEDENELVERITEEFSSLFSYYQQHFLFTNSCPEKYMRKYFEFLAEEYKELDKDEWLPHLKDETELIELAFFIQDREFGLKLSTQFSEALFEHFKLIYNGKIELTNQELKSKWNVLLKSLKNDVKITLLRNMKDHIESDTNNEGSVSRVGDIYDSIFLENEIYLYNPEKFVRTVFSRVLSKNDEDELDWLKNLIKQEPKILNKAGSAAENFKEELKHLNLGDYSENGQKIIRYIANEINVELKNEPE